MEAAAIYPLEIAIRSPKRGHDDVPFIFSNWIRSLADQPPFREHIDSPRPAVGATYDNRAHRVRALDRNWYAAAQHALVGTIVDRPSADLILAHEPGHPDHLIGFICFERVRRLVHWIYVKKGVRAGLGYRCAGVATRLMAAAFGDGKDPITFTLRTATGTALAAKWAPRWSIAFRSHFLCEEQP